MTHYLFLQSERIQNSFVYRYSSNGVISFLKELELQQQSDLVQAMHTDSLIPSAEMNDTLLYSFPYTPPGGYQVTMKVYQEMTSAEMYSALQLQNHQFEWTIYDAESMSTLTRTYVIDQRERYLYLIVGNAENYCCLIDEDDAGVSLMPDPSIGRMEGVDYQIAESADGFVLIRQNDED